MRAGSALGGSASGADRRAARAAPSLPPSVAQKAATLQTQPAQGDRSSI